MAADARKLMHQHKRADCRVVIDVRVPRKLRAVDDRAVIADHAIVAYVRISHDEIVIAYARRTAALDGPAMHGAELAKRVVVAYLKPHGLPRVGVILRVAAHNRERAEAIVP